MIFGHMGKSKKRRGFDEFKASESLLGIRLSSFGERSPLVSWCRALSFWLVIQKQESLTTGRQQRMQTSKHIGTIELFLCQLCKGNTAADKHQTIFRSGPPRKAHKQTPVWMLLVLQKFNHIFVCFFSI